MKYIIPVLMAFLLISPQVVPAHAQQCPSEDENYRRTHHKHNSLFSREEFRKKKEEYFIRTVPLTSEEAETVLKYIHEQKERQRTNDTKIRMLRISINAQTPSSECLATIRQIRELQYANLRIETEYQKKFLKVISPYKYIRLMNADNEFDRKMLSDMTYNGRKGSFK